MFGQLRIRNRLLLSTLIVAALVCVTGVIGLWASDSVGREGLEVADELVPLDNAAREMKLCTTEAHLWIEEVLSGDTGEDIEECFGLLAEARDHCDAILEGTADGRVVATVDPAVRASTERARAALGRFEAIARKRHARLGQDVGAGSELDQEFDREYDVAMAGADEAIERIHGAVRARVAALRAHVEDAHVMIVATLAVGILLALLLGVLLARTLTAPIDALKRAALTVATGDLDVRVEATSSDEIGVLGDAFQSMIRGLRGATVQLRESAGQVSVTVAQLASSTSEVSAASSETSAAMTEAVATIETVKSRVNATTDRSRHVSQIAGDAADVAESGRAAVATSIRGIEDIRTEMDDIARSIMALNEQGQAIAEIISTVNELAERSNLLAVNAAIEAAKAGDEGRGFVVVADEIRALAEQSKRSTTEVRSILSRIQKDTAASVMAAERGRKAVEVGIERAAQAGDSIAALAGAIDDVADNAGEISTAMQQVDASVNQVFTAMASVLAATQQNDSAIGEVDAAIRDLERTADVLHDRASRYRTGTSTPGAASARPPVAPEAPLDDGPESRAPASSEVLVPA